MKNTMVSLFLGVFLVLGLGQVYASGAMNEKKNTTASSKEVGNKVCPVSGQEVGSMGDIVKHEYKGKIYNLCCAGCIKDFSKDPEKYSKIAES